ncbi:hypothetical protein BsWGS_13734 [Bradybaena similaris]
MSNDLLVYTCSDRDCSWVLAFCLKENVESLQMSSDPADVRWHSQWAALLNDSPTLVIKLLHIQNLSMSSL